MKKRPRIAIPVPTSGDSAYNRRCWPEYATAIEHSGGEPVQISLNLLPAEVADLARSCEGVLLPGSPADVNPQKYGQDRREETAPSDLPRENVDELLLQDAHNLYKPILGICFGLQLLNTWRGGTLAQHLTPVPVNHSAGPSVPRAHAILVRKGSIVGASFIGDEVSSSDLFTKAMVNSSHHQAVEIPGDNLQVSARSAEDGVIEALESASSVDPFREHFVVAVQWHPERNFDSDPGSRRLFGNFVARVRVWQPRTVQTSIG